MEPQKSVPPSPAISIEDWSIVRTMRRKKRVVRVVLDHDNNPPQPSPLPQPTIEVCRLVEQLRASGLLVVHHFEPENKVVFDIPAPAGVDDLLWASKVSERMSLEGYNAVSAPSTE